MNVIPHCFLIVEFLFHFSQAINDIFFFVPLKSICEKQIKQKQQREDLPFFDIN